MDASVDWVGGTNDIKASAHTKGEEGEGKGRCVQTLAAENDSKNDAPAYNECNGDAGFLLRGAAQTRHACPPAGILQGQSADQRQFKWRPLHVSGYKEGHLITHLENTNTQKRPS